MPEQGKWLARVRIHKNDIYSLINDRKELYGQKNVGLD